LTYNSDCDNVAILLSAVGLVSYIIRPPSLDG